MKVFRLIWALVTFPFKVAGLLIKLLTIAIVVAVLLFFLSCTPESAKKEVVQYDLPFELYSVSERDVPRDCLDGVIDVALADLSGTLREYVDLNTNSVSYDALVEQYRPSVQNLLAEDFQIIPGRKQRRAQRILNSLLEETPELSGLSFDLHIVVKKTGLPYSTCCVLPGVILMGEKLIDMAGESDSQIALILAHELGHIHTSFEYWDRQQSLINELTVDLGLPSVIGNLGTAIVGVANRGTSDAHELVCDLFALKLIANHPDYDPVEGLKIYQHFQDHNKRYVMDWTTSHPEYHRYSCLLALLEQHKIITKP